MTYAGGLYRAFIRWCKNTGIDTSPNEAGKHVDLHSLRKTFATELIERGTDPKTVQALLGHKTFAMSMQLYAKVRKGNHRQAVSQLSYGDGAAAPDHVIELPAKRAQD